MICSPLARRGEVGGEGMLVGGCKGGCAHLRDLEAQAVVVRIVCNPTRDDV